MPKPKTYSNMEELALATPIKQVEMLAAWEPPLSKREQQAIARVYAVFAIHHAEQVIRNFKGK